MKVSLQLVIVIVFATFFSTLSLSAQSSRATARFFKAIQPQFRYGSQQNFDQKSLENILKQDYEQLVPVGTRAAERLFSDSRFFSPADSNVYYYAYLNTYGDFYQIVLCIRGPFSPSLVLMNYAKTGRLLSEINLAGNLIDGGDYFVWNSHFVNEATLLFNYNSYYENKDRQFFCDSTLTTYSIRKDGFMRPITHKKYTVSTNLVRGAHLETLDVQQQVSHIFAPSGLKLRKDLQKRTKTQVIPYGAAIEVIHTSKTPFIIDWIQGNWAYVRYDSLEGYMFDGYLSSLPVPPIDVPKACRDDFAELLLGYVHTHLRSVGDMDTIYQASSPLDSLRLHLSQSLQDSLKLEIYQYDQAKVTELLLPESHVEEAFILLQAILTPCNDTEILNDQILFIKNRGARIFKINDREGRVSITEGKRNQVRIRMRTSLMRE